MDSLVVVRLPKSTSKDSRPKRMEGKKTPKNKKHVPTNAQILCNSEPVTINSEYHSAEDIVVPRDWVNNTSEAAIQQLVNIISAQGDSTVSAQDLGPLAPPSQASPLPRSGNSPSISTMQEWSQEPNASQPFNNIEAFQMLVTKDEQSARDVEDEQCTVEGWSIAYYAREQSPGHMTERR